MTTIDLSPSIETLTGTSGNDWFNGMPQFNYFAGELVDTLQTGDRIVGGDGWDTLEALFGYDNDRIFINATEVEKLKLSYANPWGATIDLAAAPDVEKIKLENTSTYSGGFTIQNVGDTSSFVFQNDRTLDDGWRQGEFQIAGSYADALTFDFRNSGLVNHAHPEFGEMFVVNSDNTLASTIDIKLDNANAALGLSEHMAGVQKVSIESSGANDFAIDVDNTTPASGTPAKMDYEITGHGAGKGATDKYGTGDGLNLTIGRTGNINQVVSTGFDGNMHMVLRSDLAENTTVWTGQGTDSITIEGSVNDGSTVRTGRGDDSVTIEGSVGDNVTIATGKLPGKDTVKIEGSIGDKFTLNTAEGKDTLLVGTDENHLNWIGVEATIDMGKGIDTLMADYLDNDSSVTMGDGDDTVVIRNGLGANVTIDGGAGTDAVGLDDWTVNVITNGSSSDSVSNFEKLAIYNGGGGTYTFDMSKMDNINDVTMTGDDFSGDRTIDKIRDGFTLTMKDVENQSDAVILERADYQTGDDVSADTLNLRLESADASNSQENRIDVNDRFGVLNIDGTYTGEGTHGPWFITTLLHTDSVKSLNISGDMYVDLVSPFSGVESVVSTNTAGVRVDLSGNGDATRVVTVTTGDGKDFITTGAGKVTADLGEGDNEYDGWSSASSTVTAGNGNNNIYTGDGDDSVTLGDGNNDVVTYDFFGIGSDGKDTVTVGDGNNWIDTGEGDDTVTTGNGNNTVYGGTGKDTITTGSGNDKIYAGADNDTVVTGGGNDTVYFGNGVDNVDAGTGADTVYATSDVGNDTAGDTIDLGNDGDKDTVVYASRDNSSYAPQARDTVKNFESGEDKIDLSALATEANFAFVGNYHVTDDLSSAMVAEYNGGLDTQDGVTAGFLIDNAALYVNYANDKDGTAGNGDALESASDLQDDLVITLDGVTALSEDDFVLA